MTIVQEAATRGFGASFRVILGSATADLLLLLPALAFSWLIAQVAAAGKAEVARYAQLFIGG